MKLYEKACACLFMYISNYKYPSSVTNQPSENVSKTVCI